MSSREVALLVDATEDITREAAAESGKVRDVLLVWQFPEEIEAVLSRDCGAW